MSTFFKAALWVVGIFFLLSLMPVFYVNVEGINHWISMGGIAENVVGFGIALLVFFILAAVFISLFAGLFVVFAMIMGAVVLAGLSAIWPIVLIGIIGYLLFSKSSKYK